ncbi:metal ABC transporter substrate-binding protein [Nocardiopsis sp. ARC36]
MREHTRTTRGAAAALALSAALAGCSGAAPGGGGLAVVTTTEILADLVSRVGADLVDVSSLVPPGGDPHSYEPTPADAVRVTEADVAFTNHLLLEEQALIKAIDNNIPRTPSTCPWPRCPRPTAPM